MVDVRKLESLIISLSDFDSMQTDDFFINSMNELSTESKSNDYTITEDVVMQIANEVLDLFRQHKNALNFDIDSDMFFIDMFDYMDDGKDFNVKGMCYTYSAIKFDFNIHIILLATSLLYLNDKDDRDISIIKSVVAHEICHAIAYNRTGSDSNPHGKAFLEIANLVQDLTGFPCFDKLPKKDTLYIESHIPDTGFAVICENCGYVHKVHPNKKDELNPRNYRCPMCHCPNMNSYLKNADTGEYELFRRGKGADKFKYHCRCTNCASSSGFNRITRKYARYMELMSVGVCQECLHCNNGVIYLDMNGVILNPDTLNDMNSDARKIYDTVKHPEKIVRWKKQNTVK